MVESKCDITETSYTFTPDNLSPDHLFNFTVTPRSNVPGSLNGTTSEPVRGYIIGSKCCIFLQFRRDRVMFYSQQC